MQELNTIQVKLKAPKGQYNNFGKYTYRNCEDILEAVKPLLEETKTTLTLSDEIQQIGNRYYVKAVATLTNSKGEKESVSAYAREDETKKGMDLSQLTGSTSSYARKYALNGLFAIDDTKDSDNDEEPKQTTQPPTRTSGDNTITEQQVNHLWAVAGGTKNQNIVKAVLTAFGYTSTKDIKMKDYNNVLDALKNSLGGWYGSRILRRNTGEC